MNKIIGLLKKLLHKKIGHSTNQSDSKKIIIVLGSMGRGGAERVISIISDHFANQGWKVWILLLLSNRVDYQLNKNVQVVDLTGSTNSRLRRLPAWIVGIRKEVVQIKPNAILSFVARINIIVLIACAGLKTRIIVSERNDPYSDGRSKGVVFLTKNLYPKATAVVFQTKRAESFFCDCHLANSHVIANPITVNCLAQQPVEGKIVTVGRLTAQKNQIMLIDAFSKLCNEFSDLNLYIYGEGHMLKDLENRVAQLNIADRVFFEGNVSNVHECICDGEIFVLSSDFEGLSNALLEAMMMGLPCISTNCAGSDEYIRNGENGLLVPVGDKKAMEYAIERLHRNKHERKMYGMASARDADKYSKDSVLLQWYTLIDKDVKL